MLKAILFDLDETLYPRSSALMPEIGRRIERYIVDRVGLAPAEAELARRRWRTTYGTALRGLIEEGFPFDPDDYLAYVHDIPLDGLIEAQPNVRAMLLGIPLRRIVLTNSDLAHATRVLEKIRLLDCFERIIDIRALAYNNKPDPQAYTIALNLLGVRADEAILVEDTPVNTRTAKALGMRTILVDCPLTADSDHCVASLLEVGGVVQELLGDNLSLTS